jgi:hypothetical protein
MWRMEPGYALVHVRGEYEDVVVSEAETERAKWIGYRTIDGARFGVFKLGRKVYFQLAENLLADSPREVGRRRAAPKRGARKLRRKAARKSARRGGRRPTRRRPRAVPRRSKSTARAASPRRSAPKRGRRPARKSTAKRAARKIPRRRPVKDRPRSVGKSCSVRHRVTHVASCPSRRRSARPARRR